jgi:hypothetical protein
MSSKPMIKVALLVFVLGSLVVLAVKESRRWTTPDPVAAQEGSVAAAAPAKPQTDKIIAYYFHTTYRCATCQRIEAYSREAIDTGFARELKEGSLEFRLVNIQLPENRHFIEDYQLYTKSLVLVRIKDGKQVEWTNLDRVWELTGNRDAFVGYVQQGVRGYLEKK